MKAQFMVSARFLLYNFLSKVLESNNLYLTFQYIPRFLYISCYYKHTSKHAYDNMI